MITGGSGYVSLTAVAHGGEGGQGGFSGPGGPGEAPQGDGGAATAEPSFNTIAAARPPTT